MELTKGLEADPSPTMYVKWLCSIHTYTHTVPFTAGDPWSPDSQTEWVAGPQQPCIVLPLPLFLPIFPAEEAAQLGNTPAAGYKLKSRGVCLDLGSLHAHTSPAQSSVSAVETEEPDPSQLGQGATES